MTDDIFDEYDRELDDKLFEAVLKQAGRQGFIELGPLDLVWFVKKMDIDVSRSFDLIFPFKDVRWASPFGSFKIRLIDESKNT